MRCDKALPSREIDTSADGFWARRREVLRFEMEMTV
jgi:hypothetical protein